MRLSIAASLCSLAALSGCNHAAEKKPLTREAFAAAVSKCQPLDAKFTSNAEGPPSVEITISPGSSTVPDCMARALDGYAFKQLQITYDHGSA